jgi:hypothetical protein
MYRIGGCGFESPGRVLWWDLVNLRFLWRMVNILASWASCFWIRTRSRTADYLFENVCSTHLLATYCVLAARYGLWRLGATPTERWLPPLVPTASLCLQQKQHTYVLIAIFYPQFQSLSLIILTLKYENIQQAVPLTHCFPVRLFNLVSCCWRYCCVFFAVRTDFLNVI